MYLRSEEFLCFEFNCVGVEHIVSCCIVSIPRPLGIVHPVVELQHVLYRDTEPKACSLNDSRTHLTTYVHRGCFVAEVSLRGTIITIIQGIFHDLFTYHG